MDKELECLKRIDMKLYVTEREHKIFYSVVEQALLELKSIKETNPSEALKCLESIKDVLWDDDFHYQRHSKLLDTIEQALQRLEKYEQILGNGRLTDRNYKNTTLDLDNCKPYLRLGQLEDIYEEGKEK